MADKSSKQESPNEPPGRPVVPPTVTEAERTEQEKVEASLGIKLVGDVITPVASVEDEDGEA
jgi:hypothetical protein